MDFELDESFGFGTFAKVVVTIKTKEEIEILREGGKILATALSMLQEHVKPGAVLSDLNARSHDYIERRGAASAFLGYGGGKKHPPYPAALCASVNDEVVHGVGTRKVSLKSGDILGLDFGIRYPSNGGLYTDAALTVGVGRISRQAEQLIQQTKAALDQSIAALRPGVTTHDISKIIQKHCERYEYNVVRDLTGHGVGYGVHEDPPIFCFHDPGHPLTTFQEGMVICIEPMVMTGDWHVVIDDDGWTVRTADHSLAAHFEHTIAITHDGCEVLTTTERKN